MIWSVEKDIQFYAFFLHCIIFPKSYPNKISQLTSFSLPGLTKYPQQGGQQFSFTFFTFGYSKRQFLSDGIC